MLLQFFSTRIRGEIKRMNRLESTGFRDEDPDFVLDPSLAAVDPKIKQALDYWNAVRGERFAPARGEIDPREAKAFLPHLQIFDILDGGRAFRPRLVGTAITRTLKEDPTGRVFDDSSPQKAARRTLRAIRWTLEHRKPLRTFATRTAVESQDFLSHETIFLPLSSDGQTIDMMAIVGVFSPAAM